jgi:hypothetical protein
VRSSKRRALAIVASCIAHLLVVGALLRDVASVRLVDQNPSPAIQVQLAFVPRLRDSAVQHRAIGQAAPISLRSSPVPRAQLQAPSPPLPGPAVEAARAQTPERLGAALRNSLVGCRMMDTVPLDRSIRDRCLERLGERLREATAIGGIPASKRAAYDVVAYEQEEARAFFHVPTIGHLYPQGAGGIAGGPASTEIFSHNVGDPSPPKDPLLKRLSKSVGTPIPDR